MNKNNKLQTRTDLSVLDHESVIRFQISEFIQLQNNLEK